MKLKDETVSVRLTPMQVAQLLEVIEKGKTLYPRETEDIAKALRRPFRKVEI